METNKIKAIRNILPIGIAEAKKLIEEYKEVDLAVDHWNAETEKKELEKTMEKYGDLSSFYEFTPAYCKEIPDDHKRRIKP